MRISDRKPLYPSIGTLYPDATALLAEAGEESALGAALDSFPVYRKIWEVHQGEGVDSKSIDDAFYERDVQMAELAFQSQMHFGTYRPAILTQCMRRCRVPDLSRVLPCCSLLLRVREAERAGGAQPGVDLRVHRAEPARRHQQLHPDLQRQRAVARQGLQQALSGRPDRARRQGRSRRGKMRSSRQPARRLSALIDRFKLE